MFDLFHFLIWNFNTFIYKSLNKIIKPNLNSPPIFQF